MADTTTPLLGLLLMGTGGDNNAWGSNLNTQVITLIENAIAGVTSLSVTGGSHSLSATEARSATIILTGTLTADQTIVVPGTTKKWTFINQCTGAFFVIVKAGSGSGCNVPVETSKDITCTDANTVIRKDRDQVGRFFYHSGTSTPAGAFHCNGALALRASVIDLFNEIGTTWGPGDGFTSFAVPNAEDTGRFLRSIGPGLAVGVTQTNQFPSHTHTGSGTTGGQSADHSHTFSGNTGTESAAHTHSYLEPQNVAGETGGGAFPADTGSGIGGNTGTESVSHTHFYSGTTSGISVGHTHNFAFTTDAAGTGSETRPESMVGLLCINY